MHGHVGGFSIHDLDRLTDCRELKDYLALLIKCHAARCPQCNGGPNTQSLRDVNPVELRVIPEDIFSLLNSGDEGDTRDTDNRADSKEDGNESKWLAERPGLAMSSTRLSATPEPPPCSDPIHNAKSKVKKNSKKRSKRESQSGSQSSQTVAHRRRSRRASDRSSNFEF